MQKKLPLINSAHGSETRNIINELIKLFNGMGYTYNEALQKAHNVLNEARQTNEMNKDVQQQIDDLILADGESDAEVVQARGSFDLLSNRLNSIDEKIQQISVNVKDFGAIGDGESHPLSERFKYLSQAKEVYPHAYALDNEIDWCAIQAAVDYAVSQGGGKVLMPSGEYLVNNTIMLDSNITLEGNGRFNTILKPTWKGQNAFESLISNPGTGTDRREGIEVSHFGVDCSNLEFWETASTDYQAGNFGRIEARYVDGFYGHDISCYHGTHVFEIRSCTNFQIENIITDYCFNTIHMLGSVGPQEKGLISNIIATRCTTVVDFGAGGGDVIISDIYADAAGYVRNDQEAFDIGGATNVLIKDSILKNFERGAVLKYENDENWDNIRFHNVRFEGFTKEAIDGVIPESGIGKGIVEVIDCSFYSQVMESSDRYFFRIQAQDYEVYIENMKADINGSAIFTPTFKTFKGSNIDIKAGGKGSLIKGLEQTRADRVELHNFNTSCDSDPLEVSHTDTFNLTNFDLFGNNGSFTMRYVKTPRIRGGRIESGDGLLRYYFDAIHVESKAGMNYLPFEISDVDFVDWGKNATLRPALSFFKSSNLDGTGSFIGLKLKDLRLSISDGLENEQLGISRGTFDDTPIEYSILDNILILNVRHEEVGNASGIGENNIKNILKFRP